jgi:hypothetical protein
MFIGMFGLVGFASQHGKAPERETRLASCGGSPKILHDNNDKKLSLFSRAQNFSFYVYAPAIGELVPM